LAGKLFWILENHLLDGGFNMAAPKNRFLGMATSRKPSSAVFGKGGRIFGLKLDVAGQLVNIAGAIWRC
jgi:hypothetical protein